MNKACSKGYTLPVGYTFDNTRLLWGLPQQPRSLRRDTAKRRVFGIITKEERRKGREFEHGTGHPGILSQLQASSPNFDSTRGMNTTEKDLEWSTQLKQNFPHRRQKEESSEAAKSTWEPTQQSFKSTELEEPPFPT